MRRVSLTKAFACCGHLSEICLAGCVSSHASFHPRRGSRKACCHFEKHCTRRGTRQLPGHSVHPLAWHLVLISRRPSWYYAPANQHVPSARRTHLPFPLSHRNLEREDICSQPPRGRRAARELRRNGRELQRRQQYKPTAQHRQSHMYLALAADAPCKGFASKDALRLCLTTVA